MKNNQKKKLNVLVTGGSRGIGRAVSLTFAKNTAHTVIVNYLQNQKEALHTKQLIEEQNCRCILAKNNLMYPDEIDKLFNTVAESVNHLDIFVHCAALGTFKPLMDIKPNQWDMTMNINARSFLYSVQKSVPLMKKGTIVAISSLGSQKVVANYGAMGPTKAALESIIRYLAVELAADGIRVNGVLGGFIETDSIYKFPNSQTLIKEVKKKTPAKRIGVPDDIAEAVLFLTSPSASWIYGQILVVDGGISLF